MNKIGHLWITNQVTRQLNPQRRIWVLLGSITPDLLLHTFFKKHTWDSTFERNLIHLENLWENGTMSPVHLLKMGYYLHFIEDYFTYAHNKTFPGRILAHIIYEKDLTSYLLSETNHIPDPNTMTLFSSSIDMLYLYLNVLHDKYLNSKWSIEKDVEYMMNASTAFVQCLISSFEQRKLLNHKFISLFHQFTSTYSAFCKLKA